MLFALLSTFGLTIIIKTKQEFACDNDIFESLKAGRLETGSCFVDLTTALSSYHDQLLPTVSNLQKIASTVGQLTTTELRLLQKYSI
jgi:hypothetical protein